MGQKVEERKKKLQVTILLIVGALTSLDLKPIQDGLFRDCLRMGEEGGGGKKGPLPKICYTYPAMVKLCTVIPYKTHHLSSPNKCCYIKIYRYKLHFNTKFLFQNYFHFSLKIVVINMVEILMMSAKMATLGYSLFIRYFLKEKCFEVNVMKS